MKPMQRILQLAFIVFVTAAAQGAAFKPVPVAAVQVPLAGVEGVIVKSGGTEPLSKVTLELRGSGNMVTTTESDGRFYFPNLQPGTYRLLARRDGYAPAEYGQGWPGGPGQPLTLAPGQQVPDIQISMTNTCAVAGRIIDQNGQPIAGGRVRAMKAWIQENRRVLRVTHEVVSDERGEYRMYWMPPGKYYVSALVQAWQVNSSVVLNPDAATGGPNAAPNASRTISRPETTRPLGTGEAENEIYLPVYYPRTVDGEMAQVVDLPPGSDLRGMDIVVAPVRTYHVRGALKDIPPPPAPAQAGAAAPPRGGGGRGGIQVRMAPVSSLGNTYSSNADLTTGLFDFPKVVAGAYVLYTFIDGTTSRTPIEVRSQDLDGVGLNITSGVDLPVRVTLDGPPPEKFPELASLRVMLYRDPTLMNAPAMPAATTGDLRIPNLAPGDYRVYVQPLLSPMASLDPAVVPATWQNAYVKSIRLGDAEVLNGGLHYTPQPDSVLDIVIGTNPGTLEGRVLNDRMEVVPGAAVILFADSPSVRIVRTDQYKTAGTDRAGRFQAKNLPPGDYRVYAWEGLEKDVWLDPDFERNQGPGQRVHIEEGKASTVDLPVIRAR